MLINEVSQNVELVLYGIFGIVILGFLVIDLGLLNRKAQKISTQSALYQTIFWFAISFAFGILIYYYYGGEENTLTFYSAYLTEKALSVDNIFVIILILKYFKINDEYYHKILFWGILGALVFRAVFIFLGAFLISQFHWILYIFGAFLIYSGFKLLVAKDDDEFEPEKSPVIKYARRFLNITSGHHEGKFIFRNSGKVYFTPLFLVIVLIETTDLIFAVDSIPAAFAITTNEFLIYTSNIFAVLGLRAMFFLLAGVIDRFHMLQKGLSLILVFIGGKMMLEIFDLHVPIYLSFTIIIISLISSIILSMIIPKPSKVAEKITNPTV
jgi:tellurite resistance protein TerC